MWLKNEWILCLRSFQRRVLLKIKLLQIILVKITLVKNDSENHDIHVSENHVIHVSENHISEIRVRGHP